jgi:hypothetical protein
MLDHDEKNDEKLLAQCFVQARFPVRLNLPDGSPGSLDNAKEAIRREYRDSVKWKRLRCRSVAVLSETETGTVFILAVG